MVLPRNTLPAAVLELAKGLRINHLRISQRKRIVIVSRTETRILTDSHSLA
jgi:hypothetical protein